MSTPRLAQVGDVLIADQKFPQPGGKYVVMATAFTGGGTAMWNDRYPDGHQVTCKKLKDDDTYDLDGEVFTFYQTGSFANMIPNPNFADFRMTLFMVPIVAKTGVPASVESTSYQAPDRATILTRIQNHFQMVDQEAEGTHWSGAAKYESMAKALIELLEIHDCGSVGGFDRDDPKCGKHRNLRSRFQWLCDKYQQQKLSPQNSLDVGYSEYVK